jgi:hypothetical protein
MAEGRQGIADPLEKPKVLKLLCGLLRESAFAD